MKIQILGAGKMGVFFSDVLSCNHTVAIFDVNQKRLKFTSNCIRMSNLKEVKSFNPDILINAVALQYTIIAFRQVLPYLSKSCILSDIASIKTGLKTFYKKNKYSFVSTHPMFGPTFSNLNDLYSENAILISESDRIGKCFFEKVYNNLKLNIFEYSFEEHDKTIAYSLSVPFASTIIFASMMKKQHAPGTTFKKHMNIATGLLSEDDYLLIEILFNPYTSKHLKQIHQKLSNLSQIIKNKDVHSMKLFLNRIRKKIT